MIELFINLQLFAEAGTLVNATNQYVNAYTGEGTAFTDSKTLAPNNKIFYDTTMLKNHRDKLVFAQLGTKQTLPEHTGQTVEWQKWDTLGDCDQLTEGVIPTGDKLGMTTQSVTIYQYGKYVAISDKQMTHGLRSAVLGATEEIGASAGKTEDKLVRNVLAANTNILFADAYNGDTYVSTPSTEAELQTALASYTCNLTPDMVAKAVVTLEKGGADPHTGSDFVCVAHPSVLYDLRRNKEWIDFHKYAATRELFKNEMGELNGVRFISDTLAPVIKGTGQTYATYKTMFFGKDAFAVVDPEGGSRETFIKSPKEVGGPLEQFGTVGVKFETACKVLYPERMVTVWCGSKYSTVDDAN